METLPKKVKDTLNVLKKTPFFKAPTDIKALIELALELYQQAYPDKIKGSIFNKLSKKPEEKKKEETSASTSAKKSDKKDKGKAPTKHDDKPTAPCTYCKQTGHGHMNCPKLKADKAAGTFIPYAERVRRENEAKAKARAPVPSGSGKGQSSGKKTYSAPPADGKMGRPGPHNHWNYPGSPRPNNVS
ncbi:hypothetical protein WOLCODRAFT_149762 [Wolfiporia cocos MD-104 SS10]|uniref:CCHC-type domain-containing protein n=1 Tax=Wolfiporia cocos (strain MD-104) TaxID=742152 RepID=A0A2H3JCV5_WOLCO|nr:hypothetical protein WOLCODRAFT_149762 [Wolfiporia cocos MD-104 SS10]